jgi:phage baseplate assembly protein W
MDNLGFLGRGMKFPPQVNKGTGRFMMSSGKDSVRESVYIILMTQRGERWLEPNFGSGLMSYTFMDTSITMLSLMASELRNTILEQEPRISDVNIDIEPNVKDDCLIINIQYVIAETNTPDNLVFPFYLNASGEGISDETEE